MSAPFHPEINEGGEQPVTIAALFYGDYPELATRLLSTLAASVPPGKALFRIGLNSVGDRTRAALDELLPLLKPEMVVDSPVNLYKGPMMRRLFYDQVIQTDWTLWFDDDSFVFRPDWLFILQMMIHNRPGITMWGQKMFIRTWPELEAFVQESPWYREQPLLEDTEGKGHRISFIAGGFWAVQTSWLYRLNWPDPRLAHFGDDYLLGEALRQNGAAVGNAFSGVAVNRAARRAPPSVPRSSTLF